MRIKKIDLRFNLGVDRELEKAIEAARLQNRTTKTGYIRDCLLKELRKTGYLKAEWAGEATR